MTCEGKLYFFSLLDLREKKKELWKKRKINYFIWCWNLTYVDNMFRHPANINTYMCMHKIYNSQSIQSIFVFFLYTHYTYYVYVSTLLFTRKPKLYVYRDKIKKLDGLLMRFLFSDSFCNNKLIIRFKTKIYIYISLCFILRSAH